MSMGRLDVYKRQVEIRNCNIVCGDDGIVVKSSRQRVDFGECANIHVHDLSLIHILAL